MGVDTGNARLAAFKQRFLNVVGAVFLALVMSIGLVEMTKTPEEQERERTRVMLKLRCAELRRGLDPAGFNDSATRHQLESDCRRAGLLEARPG
jgi:hypothetical protein